MAQLTTVIPVYNGERYLPTTLESLARQTRRADRIVILDNCSTDGTRAVVERFPGLRCEWRQNETNIGSAANLNRALGLAPETDYLHILLADDLIKPRFYECALTALAPVSGRAMAYSWYELVGEAGQPLGGLASKPARPARIVPKARFLAAQAELRTVLCPAVVHRTARQPSPAFFDVALPQLADNLFYAQWASQCEAIFETPEVLCQNRQHLLNATHQNIFNLQAWVLDEWEVMQAVSALLGEAGVRKWLRWQKLKCLFAARSQVKIQMVRDQDPDYAREIRRATGQVVSPLHWMLGKLAVGVRDTIQPDAARRHRQRTIAFRG